MAEAYFNQINKNKTLKTKGAGLIKGRHINPKQAQVAKNLGIIMAGKPQSITLDLLSWADLLVIVADNVPPILFKGNEFKGKLIVWKIRDAHADNPKDIARAVNQIKARVDDLVKNLK